MVRDESAHQGKLICVFDLESLEHRFIEAVKDGSFYQSVVRSEAAFMSIGELKRASLERLKLNEFITETRNDKAVDEKKAWLIRFNGVIPARWLDPKNVVVDIELAGNSGAQLSTPLLNAGIEHPLTAVVYQTFVSQRLSSDQLVKAFRRYDAVDASNDWSSQIRERQRAKGVTDGTIVVAYYQSKSRNWGSTRNK